MPAMWVNAICLVYLAAALVPARLHMDEDETPPQLNLARVATINKTFKNNDKQDVPVTPDMYTAATRGTETPVQVGGPTTPPPKHKVQKKLYKEIEGSEGEKPKLEKRPEQHSGETPNTNKEKDKAVDHVSGHCDCVKNWKDFKHICNLDFHFGLEVLVRNRTDNGFYVTLVDIYKAPDVLSSPLVKGQTVHLRFPSSNIDFNLKFAHCKCVTMKHRRRYVAFGYRSEDAGSSSGSDILHVHQAIHTGTASEVYSRLTKLLRQIINHQCEESREHAHPTSGKTELKVDKVGKPVQTNNDDGSHQNSNNVYGRLNVSGVPVREVSP